MAFVWTDENISTLIHLWNFERLPSADIGFILGTTKNAVIGKAHRLRLQRRQTVVESQRDPEVRKPGPTLMIFKKIKPAILPRPEPEITVLSSATNVTLDDLGTHHCRNIIGRENGEPVYCGAKRLYYRNRYDQNVRSPYCPVHHAINHQPDRGIYHGYRERYRQ